MKRIYILVLSLIIGVVGCDQNPGSNVSSSKEQQVPTQQVLSKQPLSLSQESYPSKGGESSQGYYDQAVSFLNNRKIPQAINALQKEIQMNPRDSRTYMLMGQLFMSLKNYKQAMRYFMATVQLDPRNGQVYLLMGGCFDLMGQTADAIKSVKRSIILFQQNGDQRSLQKAINILKVLENKNG